MKPFIDLLKDFINNYLQFDNIKNRCRLIICHAVKIDDRHNTVMRDLVHSL
jgi:hypothetical protein